MNNCNCYDIQEINQNVDSLYFLSALLIVAEKKKVVLAKARGEIVVLETRLSSMKETEVVLMRERSELLAHIQRLDGQIKELHDQLVSVRY